MNFHLIQNFLQVLLQFCNTIVKELDKAKLAALKNFLNVQHELRYESSDKLGVHILCDAVKVAIELFFHVIGLLSKYTIQVLRKSSHCFELPLCVFDMTIDLEAVLLQVDLVLLPEFEVGCIHKRSCNERGVYTLSAWFWISDFHQSGRLRDVNKLMRERAFANLV